MLLRAELNKPKLHSLFDTQNNVSSLLKASASALAVLRVAGSGSWSCIVAASCGAVVATSAGM